MGEFCHLESL
uniref:Uncharacterized protein n=1 Tax=Anguilla anguilla TaxID=7936 RepID=A0A0E9VTV5_ANGAN